MIEILTSNGSFYKIDQSLANTFLVYFWDNSNNDFVYIEDYDLNESRKAVLFALEVDKDTNFYEIRFEDIPYTVEEFLDIGYILNYIKTNLQKTNHN
jgi:hypothetical protein